MKKLTREEIDNMKHKLLSIIPLILTLIGLYVANLNAFYIDRNAILNGTWIMISPIVVYFFYTLFWRSQEKIDLVAPLVSFGLEVLFCIACNSYYVCNPMLFEDVIYAGQRVLFAVLVFIYGLFVLANYLIIKDTKKYGKDPVKTDKVEEQ